MPSLRNLSGGLALAASVCLFAPAVHAQAPLLDTFGGPVGYGTNNLPSNDDSSSAAQDLTAAFPGGLNFFGGPYTDVYINNNGNITFNGSVRTWTPSAFPIADRPMIAPYWGDVDTRGGGAPNNNGVFWHFEPGRMVATWHNVGYYNTHDDKKMDFQLILTNALDCRAGDFDVEFRYNRCEWTTGDASSGSGGLGGTPAQAGFDSGNGVDFVEIPGSRTAAILDLCTTSNVGVPGVWRFSVRGGMVECPDAGGICDTGMAGACGVGVNQCVGDGVECRQIGTSTPERCDGIDNDCDGSTDNGDDLCAGQFEVCLNGTCVPRCFEGGCAAGEACNADGVCVESACVDVNCPANQRCLGGECLDACGGVTCPHNQQCVAGRCTDLCDVLECAMGEVCVDGQCVAQCPCRPCAADEICGADGSCTPVGCDIVTCDPGFYCSGGECLDACAGTTCPSGQICQLGDCVDGTPPAPDAGPPLTFDGGANPNMGVDAGTGETGDVDGATGDFDAGRRVVIPPGGGAGCACRASESREAPGLLWGLAVLGLLVWRRRASR